MGNKVVSLFSGGGGLDIGFKEAGFEVVWAIDNESNAVSTYAANIGNHIICADINAVDLNIIPKCDIVIGGPPCQSFSLAGNRNTNDDRGRLVWKYIEIIKHLKPRAFLFENVTGLLSAKNCDGEKIFPLLEKKFTALGYSINSQIVNAADYGVPQLRRRVIIVGIQGNKKFEFPGTTHGKDKQPYLSVAEALDDLPSATKENISQNYITDAKTEFQKKIRCGSLKVTDHVISQMSELDRYIVDHVKPGGNYMDIPSDVASKRIRRLQQTGGHTTCYGRLDPNKPAYTINTYFNRPNVGCNIHYKENRLITVREALRLQTFPDKYEIVSSNKQGRNTIVGNAVPPLLAKILAVALKEQIGENYVDIIFRFRSK